MVLKIGILFKTPSNKDTNLLPIKVKDNQPINVIKIKAIKISRPGISYGKKRSGFIAWGIKLEEILIKKIVKYTVIPIGISTKTPAIK